MRNIVVSMLMGVALLSGTAQAATAQQQKMTTCNADAKTKELKGDARKDFMKTCLSADAAAPSAAPSAAQAAQQAKMKSCNVDAKTKELKGDARKSFMKTCLSAG